MASKNSRTQNSLGNYAISGMSETSAKEFVENIVRWQLHQDISDPYGHSSAPSDVISPEELEYVLSHMEYDVDHLTRVEEVGISVDPSELREGNIISFNKPLRAFSRNVNNTLEYLANEYKGEGYPLIVYETEGLGHFDITKLSHVYEAEGESWVNCENVRVKEIETRTMSLPAYDGMNYDFNIYWIKLEKV